jgi:acetyl esterase/lipase
VPAALFVIGVVVLAAKANASRPTRLRYLREPSFFFSWIVIELAPWWLVIEAATLVGLVAAGGLEGWDGWTGAALIVASWILLGWIIVLSARTSATLRAAGAPPGGQVRFPRIQVVFPFLLTHRRGVRRLKNVVYAEVDGERLRLDIYMPNDWRGVAPARRSGGSPGGAAVGGRVPGGDAATPRPGIIQLHGGDWSFGDKGTEGVPLLGHLAACGWVGLSANYRLSPKVAFPAHLQDVKRVVAWYREHAAEYGADPDFLCVTGGSAGGHLATLAALTPNDAEYQPGFTGVDTSVRAAAVWYGVYDFTNRLGTWQRHEMRMLERNVMQRTLADHPADFARASPLDRLRADAPPFLIVHGSIDSLVPVAEARAFASRLGAVSAQPVVFAELKGAQHAFDVFPSHRCARAVEAAERFLAGVHEAYLAGRQAGTAAPPA